MKKESRCVNDCRMFPGILSTEVQHRSSSLISFTFKVFKGNLMG